MTTWAVYRVSTGEITNRTRDPSGKMAAPTFDDPDFAAIEVSEDDDLRGSYIGLDGLLYSLPPKPHDHCHWDRDAVAWVDDLQAAKYARWEAMKVARDAAEVSGVIYDGVEYDTDPMSVQRITGACLQANVDPTMTWDWTAADNSVVTLDAAQMVALGTAVAAHVSACHAHSRTLRDQINAATTIAEVDAVTWSL